ncbi:MarR family winged helix-turn-helix transcriptional regulator [Aeromicrobium sp. CF3.5]|uniref:MarR family winged helix-turn-helix transcriptional regulator n=1 Tax=Aeromicrobium sp. CF3.5 TaxID=3373078 RepID=UPI003EE7F4B2
MNRDLSDLVDVDVELARFIRRVRVQSLRRLEAIHPRLDYGSFLFLIMICDATGGIRGSELAEALGVHKSTASRAIAGLERMELVSRIPDPDDGRAQLLVAERSAIASLEEYRSTSRARLSEVLADWSPEEVEAFSRAMARLNDTAEELS